MGESASRDGSDAQADELIASQWRQLRELLSGPERRRLDEILARLNDPVRRAEELSQALPDAITLSHANGDRMAQALGPTIDTVLKRSVRRNPAFIADVIFPALGPAIRKSVIATLLGMIQSLNQLLNQTVSLRGIKWRLEAFRTHRPFAEVVLLHSLVYQVEQIFLVHRHTGVVLQHVASLDIQVRDPDLVSGMLTAIQDFIKDSFDAHHGDTLDTLRMGGDHSVWIEQGAEAFLAVVLRGTPPLTMRERFKGLLKEIHETFSSKWADFDGEVAPFDMIRPQLENELIVEMREVKQRASPLLWLAGAAAVALVLFGTWHFLQQRRHWQNYLAKLRAQSGIVVTTAHQGWGQYYIEGLRDPLAADPRELMAAAGIDPQQVHSRWRYYQALEGPLVLRRAEQILKPPPGVQLNLRQGVLAASGSASHEWVVKLSRLAPAIAGVSACDTRQLKDIQMVELYALASRLSRLSITFASGRSVLAPDQQPTLMTASSLIARMQSMAQQSGIQIHIKVIGRSDPTGPPLLNLHLSQDRSSRVLRFLFAKGLDPTLLSPVGRGSDMPFQTGDAQEHFDTERSVTFQTLINGKEACP